MAGSYQHTTFQNLIDQMAIDVASPGKTFFKDSGAQPEIRGSLWEALRVWNLLTGFNRDTGAFLTTPGTGIYDLSVKCAAQMALTIRDRELLGQMQYRLMEPYDPGAGADMTEMWSHAEFLRTLQQRRDRFLAEAETEITKLNPINVLPASGGLVPINDSIIRIVRATWTTPSGKIIALTPPMDEGSAPNAGTASWRQAPGVPYTWSVAATPNLNIQLIPPPVSSGELTLMVIQTGATLDPSAGGGTGTLVGVSDDIAWSLVWGSMEDLLLKDGLGRDPERAQFCSRMYALGVQAARSLPCVLDVQIDGVSIRPGSLHSLDRMNYAWESGNAGRPNKVGVLDHWLALCPVPDAEYEVKVLMVRSAPAPAVGDYLNLGREHLAAIRGWAKQILMFKQEGSQLEQGIAAAASLIQQARIYNEARIADSVQLDQMLSTSPGTMDSVRPRLESPVRGPEQDPRDTSSTAVTRSSDTSRTGSRRRLGGR